MNTKNKIYILGDSFCTHITYYNNRGEHKFYWVKGFWNEFKKTHDLVVDAMPSRDIQTIIDNWIKLLKHIKKDDILIICVPFFLRIRVPLHKKDYIIDTYDDFKIVNRFVTHHSWYETENEKIYVGDEIIEKEDLDKHICFIERIFYESHAVEQNYNEVIKSLYDLTDCNKYFFSWDTMKNRISEIEYKDDLDKKLGWGTMSELYDKTNGMDGKKGDFHWDYDFQRKFSSYLIDKFKK
jgi:hypothetical protein